MTPKVTRFLAEQQPATPCLVLDVDRVEANFRSLQRALPLAAGMYYVIVDNTTSAGQVQPAPPLFGVVGDTPAVVSYVIQIGDAP